RLRGRQSCRMVRGQLPGLRSRPASPARRRGRSAAPHQVQAVGAPLGSSLATQDGAMHDDISVGHFVRGMRLLVGTVVLQALAQIALNRVTMALPLPMRDASQRSPLWLAYVVSCVLVLMLGHIAQVVLWASLYFHLNELGSFASCVYFSLASFTT